MNRIAVAGISWRQGGPEALARFTLATEGRPEAVKRLAAGLGVAELVYVATCNRVEVAFVGDGRTALGAYRPRIFEGLTGGSGTPGEAARTFRAWAGEGAMEHLILVTAGLDSARVGETDVAAQVRRSFEQSRELGLVGTRLGLVFEEALKVARRVHASTALGHGRESLAEIALDRLRSRLAEAAGPVALVGVSAMTERCARSLAAEGTRVVVVNRTLARALEFAQSAGAEALALADFLAEPPGVEAIVSATGAEAAVFRRADLERLAARVPSGRPLLAVDMAVPPDVEPGDARAAGVERIGMEEVIAEAERSRERRLEEMADARTLVDEALLSLRRRLSDRLVAPLLAAVQRRYRSTAVEGLERLFKRELVGLGESERDAVRRWAETLARRFAHLPTAGLREVAHAAGPEAVDAFFSRADAGLAAALREAAREADGILAPPREAEGAS